MTTESNRDLLGAIERLLTQSTHALQVIASREAQHTEALRGWAEPDGFLLPTEPDADERRRIRDCLHASLRELSLIKHAIDPAPDLVRALLARLRQQEQARTEVTGHCGDCGGTEFVVVERCEGCGCEEQVERLRGTDPPAVARLRPLDQEPER